MKILLLIALVTSSILHSCPLCVGTVEHDSPPFFSNECYQCNKELYDFKSTGSETSHSFVEEK